MNSVIERDQTILTTVQPNENINPSDTHNAVNDYVYMQLDDNNQSSTLTEALEMRIIQAQESPELVSVKPERTVAIRTRQETNENYESMTSHESTERESRQEGKKYQIQFCMIYFNAACLICLFVVAGVFICKILL